MKPVSFPKLHKPGSALHTTRVNLERGISRALSTSSGVGTLSGVCHSVFFLPPDGTECEESELGPHTISLDPPTSVSHRCLHPTPGGTNDVTNSANPSRVVFSHPDLNPTRKTCLARGCPACAATGPSHWQPYAAACRPLHQHWSFCFPWYRSLKKVSGSGDDREIVKKTAALDPRVPVYIECRDARRGGEVNGIETCTEPWTT